MIKLNIEKVLRFYDEKNANDRRQVSAITGVVGEDLAAGLIKHYFESKQGIVTVLDNHPSEHKDTERRKAKQLDRWIKVVSNSETIFYQTEIKNWSSHSLGGQKLSLNCSHQELIAYANKRFDEQWDCDSKTLRHHYVSKVLKQMKNINGINGDEKIHPLICYWFPIFPKTQHNPVPFFSESCISFFPTVYFFSMSIYLRQLLKTQQQIEIETPHIELRLKKINEMYEGNGQQ